MKSLFIILIALSFFCLNDLNAQSDFEFYGDRVSAGSKRHWLVSLRDEKDTILVPVTVFHGVKPGPVLGITAGVHGYEYSPILAGQQLIDRLDPTEMSGTVILVQVANMGSFLGRSPFTNPLDGKNLNRSFPGSASGTITERLAHFISTEVIGRSTHFIDMHSGDAPEDLVAYAGYYQNDNKPKVSEIGRSMAMAAGFEYIVEFKTTGKDYLKPEQPSLYCSAEAFKRNIPAMDFECGRLGLIEPHLIEKIVSGVERIMNKLNMTQDSAEEVSGHTFFPVRSYVSSEYDGIFYPLKKAGDYVTKGAHLGYVTDFFGKHLQEVYAPENGVILLIIGTPAINKGESVVGVGLIE
ncbi:MAG: succinylglutamate desuccinylase/aspartoacylase family protein [Roseivirga sp.]